MTPIAAIKQGLGIARRVRPEVWILFLANLGLAAIAALPIYRGILRFTGLSLMGQELASGFSRDWLTDFAFNSPGSLERYAAVIGLVGLLSIPINTILAGGVVARFRAPEQPSSLRQFFHDTVHYAWPLVRLWIIGLACYWLVFRLLHQGLGHLVDTWTRDWQNDRQVFGVKLVAGLLVLLGLAFVNLVMDFARVKLVLEEGSSAAEAFLASLGFSLARLGKAATVYALPLLAGLALLGLYRLVVPWSTINAAFSETPSALYREPLTLALLFIGQQLVMFGRTWFRVATWASEWAYYSGCHPVAPPAEPASP